MKVTPVSSTMAHLMHNAEDCIARGLVFTFSVDCCEVEEGEGLVVIRLVNANGATISACQVRMAITPENKAVIYAMVAVADRHALQVLRMERR